MSFWTTLLGAIKAYFRKTPNPPPFPPLPPTPPIPGRDATDLVAVLNAEREKLGLEPFVRDGRLDTTAAKHSSLMATYGKMSHQLPGEPPFADRILSQGYRWCFAAENVAAGQRTPEQVVRDWMNEIPPYDGHRKAIVGDYVNVGCGMSYNQKTDYLYYWTADFATEFRNPS